MTTQTQEFFQWMQEHLKDPNFQGMMFMDGTVLHPMTLRAITDPEALMTFCHQVADRAQREAAGGQN